MILMNNIFEQLRWEHQIVKDLLKKAENCNNSERKKILGKIEEKLVPHTRAEEKTLYAVLREVAKTENETNELDNVNKAYEGHNIADQLLAVLKQTKTSDEKWLPRLRALKENVEHHVKEEEGPLFRRAGQQLNDDELEQIFTAYMDAKEKYSDSLPTQELIFSKIPKEMDQKSAS